MSREINISICAVARVGVLNYGNDEEEAGKERGKERKKSKAYSALVPDLGVEVHLCVAGIFCPWRPGDPRTSSTSPGRPGALGATFFCIPDLARHHLV